MGCSFHRRAALDLRMSMDMDIGGGRARDIPDKKFDNMYFDEKRYFFCGKGFRKLVFKLLIWYIARRVGGAVRPRERTEPSNLRVLAFQG